MHRLLSVLVVAGLAATLHAKGDFDDFTTHPTGTVTGTGTGTGGAYF